MKSPASHYSPRAVLHVTSCVALLVAASGACASEGYKTRQSPIGAFGGEISAGAENPGFFGTAVTTYVHIYRIADGSGNDVAVTGRAVPLPTQTKAGLPIPDGTYTLNVAPGTIEFDQVQTQVNLLGGYLTQDTYAGGRFAFAANVPLISINRTFFATQPAGTVSPVPGAALPPQVLGAVTAVANAANYTVQSGLIARNTSENLNVSGFGDTELTAVWVRHQDRLKVAAGVSLFVPTGAYDKTRGPNPGFGNFYTLRPGVALTYSLNPNHTDSSWDSGVTVAGRFSYGVNSSNLETDYRSGSEQGHWQLGFRCQSVGHSAGDG